MMPCKLCTKYDANGVPVMVLPDGKPTRGLKQVGKTERRDKIWKNKYGEAIAEGVLGERLYRCQDCGAFWRTTLDTTTREHRDEPVFEIVKGGSAGRRMGKKKAAVGVDYTALQRDLCDAAEAARKIRNLQGDGGPSNGDGLIIKLPRAICARVEAAGRAAGLMVFRRFAGHFSVSTPYDAPAQGYENTARATAMVKWLEARGWDVSMRYFVD
jgi:hypothetical protein